MTIDYSGGTQGIIYGPRDRLGRITTVTDALGERTMGYHPDTLPLEHEDIPGLIGRRITQNFADGGPEQSRPDVHRDRRSSFRCHGRQTPSARGPRRLLLAVHLRIRLRRTGQGNGRLNGDGWGR